MSRKSKKAELMSALSEEVVHAVFLRWETEFRQHPDRFTARDDEILHSADAVARRSADLFLKYVDETGLLS